MARGRKGGPSRMDLRRQGEAAEAREGEEVEKDEDEEKDEDDEDDEDDEESEGEDDEAADPEAEAADDEDDDDAPKKKPKKKAKVAAVKKAPAKRTRAVKEVRMRASWVVFDNGNKRVETFPFSQKAEAEKFLADKIEEKKATFFLQLVKEEMS